MEIRRRCTFRCGGKNKGSRLSQGMWSRNGSWIKTVVLRSNGSQREWNYNSIELAPLCPPKCGAVAVNLRRGRQAVCRKGRHFQTLLLGYEALKTT